MDLHVESLNSAVWNGVKFKCASGRNGFATIEEKKEGDGKTPIGRWILREVFYRADRIAKPETSLPIRKIGPEDGWCDDSENEKYNRHVKLPYAYSHENLYRNDALYDIIVVIGYNDAPPIPRKGSAIFLHVAREDFGGTAGCIALEKEALLTVLREAKIGSAVLVHPAP